MYDDLVKLKRLVNVKALVEPDAIAAAERARDDLVAGKTGVFHKVLTVFATGIAFRAIADKFFDQVRGDKAHAIVLEELIGKVDPLVLHATVATHKRPGQAVVSGATPASRVYLGPVYPGTQPLRSGSELASWLVAFKVSCDFDVGPG